MSHELPQACPKYHQNYETKALIRQFTVSCYSVVNIKMAGHVKKRSTSVIIEYQVLQLWFILLRLGWLNMKNEQLHSGKKLQHLLRQASEGGNNKNQSLCQLYVKNVICADSKTERNVSFMQHHFSVRGRNFNSSSGWCAKRKIISSQQNSLRKKLPSHFEEMSEEMPSNYTIDDRGGKSVAEKMRVNVTLSWQAALNLNPISMPKTQMPMRLIIMCQTKGWRTCYKLPRTGDHKCCWQNKECLCWMHLTVNWYWMPHLCSM
jgi:hypothetical protein